MSTERMIAGMWGTTNLALFLLEGEGGNLHIRQSRVGPGASKLSKDEFETTLFEIAGDWLNIDTHRKIVLAGMVGSTLGWAEAGYVHCPAKSNDIACRPGFYARDREICIVSGLICQNSRGEVDVMRGEETEIRGAFDLLPNLVQGEHLLCIPGTHTKWIKIVGGSVVEFTTSVSGELFAVLQSSSSLIEDVAKIPSRLTNKFEEAARFSLNSPEAILHALFSVRARVVAGDDNSVEALERLSGLIIGSDVSAAAKLYGLPSSPIIIIGAPAISERYSRVLQMNGCETNIQCSKIAAAKGLWSTASLLGTKGT